MLKLFLITILTLAVIIISRSFFVQSFEPQEENPNDSKPIATKQIYLAGGCFWGIEAYFSKLPGVIKTISGYANGKTKNPGYEEVSSGATGFAETVLVEYDPKTISLKDLLNHYLDIVDPTTLNKQGNDIGTQYRSGIYYTNEADGLIIKKAVKDEEKRYKLPLVTEVKKLENFYEAEEYHQKYLDKNPHGYCHIDLSKVKKYKKPKTEDLKKKLTDIQYKVTQENATEKPFSSLYDKATEEGIYVDITSGEPLFSSKDKYDAGCGWPSFTKPIKKKMLKEKTDASLGLTRTEVRSTFGDSHLGHVFDDGPSKDGGKRFCINGAALRFVSVKNMQKEGYGEYLYLFK